MRIDREDWIFTTGKAKSGKTFWINKHLEKFPPETAYFFDFNCNDFQQFEKTQNIWNNRYGTSEELEEFLHIPYEKGNCFVVLEEADNYFAKPSQFMSQFVNTARNRGVGCIVSAKRAKAVQPKFRTRFNKLVLFHCDLPEDIDYLEKWIGVEKGKLDILKNLKLEGEYIEIDLVNHNIWDIESEVKKL